jgi:hypothetical protein
VKRAGILTSSWINLVSSQENHKNNTAIVLATAPTSHSGTSAKVTTHVAAAIHILETVLLLDASLSILIVPIHLLVPVRLFPLIIGALIPISIVVSLIYISSFV